MKSTHTFAILELSPSAFSEISRKLIKAGYQHAFQKQDGRELIDLSGIAVASEPPPSKPENPDSVIKRIMRVTTQKFQIQQKELMSRNREARISFPRQVIMFLSVEKGITLEESSGYFSRNHGTASHAVKLVQNRMDTEPKIKEIVEAIQNQIG